MPRRTLRALGAELVTMLASAPRGTSRYAGVVSPDELVDQADELELAGLPFS